MPATYMPKAPNGGTDDYRCFLLDPKLTRDSFVTGYDVEPGDASIVHHVILYRVPASKVALARAQDAQAPGDGWTCFGGTGIERQGASLDDAPWVGAWAPGGTETMLAPDLGIPMEKGSRLVLQVHYNLLHGAKPDRTGVDLRLSTSSKLTALETVLYPAPVELPCRPGKSGPCASARLPCGMSPGGSATGPRGSSRASSCSARARSSLSRGRRSRAREASRSPRWSGRQPGTCTCWDRASASS